MVIALGEKTVTIIKQLRGVNLGTEQAIELIERYEAALREIANYRHLELNPDGSVPELADAIKTADRALEGKP